MGWLSLLHKAAAWDLHWPGLNQLHPLICTVGGRVKLPELVRTAETGVCCTQPREGRRSKAETLLHKAFWLLWVFSKGSPSPSGQLLKFLLRGFLVFTLVDKLALFWGWHPQLKGRLGSWCLKETSTMTAAPSSCFPHPLALDEKFKQASLIALCCKGSYSLFQGQVICHDREQVGQWEQVREKPSEVYCLQDVPLRLFFLPRITGSKSIVLCWPRGPACHPGATGHQTPGTHLEGTMRRWAKQPITS